jgi:hypothetical protein
MRRIIIAAFLLLMFAASAFAISQIVPGTTSGYTDLSRTPGSIFNQSPVQVFAPDGRLAYSQGVASTTYDLTKNLMYGIYSGSGTCYTRQMATSANSGATQVLMSNTTWHIRAKNNNTPFVNFSGCTAGYVQIQ